MGILARLAADRVRAIAITDEKAWNPSLWNLAGSQAVSGETVTEQSALTYSAVWCAVNVIAGTIGSLPLHLMQSKDSKKRKADDLRLYRVMHDQPNKYMTAMTFRTILMSHVLTWGNGYAEIVRNSFGDVVELWPITPNRVTDIRMVDDRLTYRISMAAGEDIILPREKVLHIPGLGFDGFVGYSVVAMARRSIGLAMAMETFGSRYFGAGTHPGVVVSHPGRLGPEAHRNLTTSLEKAHSGLGQSHRMLLLEEGMKLETIGIPPNDSQFLESRQFQIPEVARWFNLPPHILKDLTRSSFNNMEQEVISLVTYCFRQWFECLEQNYNMQLLSQSDKYNTGRGRLYFKHSVEGLLRGDSAGRAAFYATMLDKGVFNINEVRELEDKDPVPGGDIHLVPLNMTTLENAGKLPEEVMPGDKEGQK